MRIGIVAPREVPIYREEVYEARRDGLGPEERKRNDQGKNDAKLGAE